MEERLRQVEKDAAVLNQGIDTIHFRLDDIRKDFNDMRVEMKAVIAQAQKTTSLEEALCRFERDMSRIITWMEKHKLSYSNLLSEHADCMKRQAKRTSWIGERAGKLLDYIIPALIAWCLVMWKSH